MCSIAQLLLLSYVDLLPPFSSSFWIDDFLPPVSLCFRTVEASLFAKDGTLLICSIAQLVLLLR
jgi:hypothetical protein